MYNYKEEEIEQQIYQVMKILNLDRMPTSREVRYSTISGLDPAISRTGGYIFWAEKLKLSPKKPYTKWNDESIKEGILNVIQKLNLDRMPSRMEILKIHNDMSLHNAIVRSYSYYEWAEKLNLKIKYSETSLGVSYQNICMKQLKEKGYNVEPTTMKAPYDILINDNIRIDVKSGCAYYDNSGCRLHSFGINKKDPVCDLYIIYALDEEGINIERTFIIPAKYLKLISMCIGINSKYNKFIDRWDYIDTYDNFYNLIK